MKSIVRLIAWIAGLGLVFGTGVVAYEKWTPRPSVLTVVFLDVGQADCIVVRTPGGHTLVVDSGRKSGDDDSGRQAALPYLRGQGINRIDALLLTHPDDDHIGGAATILDRLSVGRLLVSHFEAASSSPVFHHVREVAQRRHVPIEEVARGQTIDFHDSVVAEVLNPPDGNQPRSAHPDNDSSVVVRVRKGRTAVLLTGDAEEAAERDMERDGEDLGADVLKLGHHGSHTSSSAGFLAAVHPQIAIVSAGRHNRFGHPHPEVMARLASEHVRVFRTDEQGAITVTSDGDRLTVHSEHSETDAPAPRNP